ncbi:PREDICTED: unnamed product [Prunus dulcis]|uniref:PREDICTED: unnamed product n=1 Tax=Prunus dulcis TaxID=3755 RepID=A0A5E4FQN8_PRUDU|nr:hypothetical protein L3X38_030941 [Prunus dulcis]VVA29801.1 PREDICTED: unnamed product [Prunus dulcis]
MKHFILPEGIGQIRFRYTCDEAIEFFDKRRELITNGASHARQVLLEVITELDPLGDTSKTVLLFDGCRLANQFQALEAEEGWTNEDKWKVISQCGWMQHAQQLRHGGELLAHPVTSDENIGPYFEGTTWQQSMDVIHIFFSVIHASTIQNMKGKTICFCIPAGRKQKDNEEKHDESSHSNSRRSRKSRGHVVATGTGDHAEGNDGDTAAAAAAPTMATAAVMMSAAHMSTMDGDGGGGSAHGGGDG